VPGAFVLKRDPLAVRLAAVLVVGGGNADDAPEVAFAIVVTDQHAHELGDVEGIALGSAGAAVDFDRRGIDNVIVDTLIDEPAMQPETIAAGLVAGDHGSVVWQTETLPGAPKFHVQQSDVPRGDGSQAWLASHAGVEAEFPGGPAELEGEIERACARRCRIERVGR
jgi:hypothetical protein